MQQSRSLSGLLVLVTLAAAVAGAALALTHTAGIAGPSLLGVGVVSAIAAWIALGSPKTRRELRLQIDDQS